MEYNKILHDLENTVGGVQIKIDENKKKLEAKNIESVLENSRDLLNDILSQIDYLPIRTDENIENHISEEIDKKHIIDNSTLKTEEISVKNHNNLDDYEKSNLEIEFNKSNEKGKKEEKNEHIHQVEWEGKEVEIQRSPITEEQENPPDKEDEYQDEKETDSCFFDTV